MTTGFQKKLEIMYATKTGELLGESWEVAPGVDEVNWPDLLVTTKLGKFGLEVREIYLDETNKGSAQKAGEKDNLKIIQKIANAYYKTTSPAIKVSFLGTIGDYEQILKTITAEATRLSGVGEKRIKFNDACTIYIRKLPDNFGEYKRWDYVSDKVGWVKNLDAKCIETAIAEKAKKLSKYTKNISDVRLLLVSDRCYNSGKTRLMHKIKCNPKGFAIVYYLSYPVEVWQL